MYPSKNRPFLTTAMVLGVLTCATVAQADIINFFTPIASGTLGYNQIWANGFNNQTGTTLDTSDNTWIFNYAGIGTYNDRKAWFDFGPNWNTLNFAAVWTGFTRSSGIRQVEAWLQDAWWDDDNDATNDGTTDTALLAGLNALSAPDNADAVWIKQPNTAFVPLQRYLLLHTTSSNANPWSQRVNEFILETAPIPEPASLGLLTLGGLILIHRRRR